MLSTRNVRSARAVAGLGAKPRVRQRHCMLSTLDTATMTLLAAHCLVHF